MKRDSDVNLQAVRSHCVETETHDCVGQPVSTTPIDGLGRGDVRIVDPERVPDVQSVS